MRRGRVGRGKRGRASVLKYTKERRTRNFINHHELTSTCSIQMCYIAYCGDATQTIVVFLVPGASRSSQLITPCEQVIEYLRFCCCGRRLQSSLHFSMLVCWCRCGWRRHIHGQTDP